MQGKARTREPGAELAAAPRPPEAVTACPLDADRFHALYVEHFDFVWRTLRLFGVLPEALEDAAQEVFGVTYRRLAEFEGSASLRTWLFAIARRVAANERRRQRRRQSPLEPLIGEELSAEPTPQAHAEATEAASSIARFCEELDEERRALFVLALLEGVPAPELAEPLGLPLNTVYSRIRSLRHALRQFLERSEVMP